MKISENYVDEFLAFRYSLLLHSSESKLKAEAFVNLLELSKKLNWVYFQDELVRTGTSDSHLGLIFGDLVSNAYVDQIELKPIEEIEAFFTRLHPKDIPANAKKIRDLAFILFSMGCFNLYNMVFSRYVKNQEKMDEDEMHELIIKYFISSVIKRNFENAIRDIANLKVTYTTYDLTIYTFLLKFISGAFHEALNDSLVISNNLHDGVWNLINETDLALYFTLTLLISFDRSILKEVQSQRSILIYNIFQGDFEENKNLLESYSKCRYEFVTEKFEKLKKDFLNDPLVWNNLNKINYEVKNNILREILNGCSKVAFDYLLRTLREREIEKLENWILSGISEGYYKVKIDDIDKIVYSEDQDEVRQNIEKVVDLSKKVYTKSIKKILNSISTKVDVKEIQLDEFKRYKLDKIRSKEKKEGDFQIYSKY